MRTPIRAEPREQKNEFGSNAVFIKCALSIPRPMDGSGSLIATRNRIVLSQTSSIEFGAPHDPVPPLDPRINCSHPKQIIRRSTSRYRLTSPSPRATRMEISRPWTEFHAIISRPPGTPQSIHALDLMNLTARAAAKSPTSCSIRERQA